MTEKQETQFEVIFLKTGKFSFDTRGSKIIEVVKGEEGSFPFAEMKKIIEAGWAKQKTKSKKKKTQENTDPENTDLENKEENTDPENTDPKAEDTFLDT